MSRPKVPLASVDDVEQQFYEAMQQGDLDKMMAAWADDDDIACVHPGGPRVVGPAAVRASFELIFGHGGKVDAHPERVRRLHTPEAAVHHVVERVQALTSDGLQRGYVMATNVYLKTAHGWRMVLHHASPGSEREPRDVGEPGSTIH